AWKAERGELKPGDLPEAFAKIKRLVSPPERPTIDRRQIEKRAAVLDGQIEKGQRNLVFLDESNIPIAQEEIRRLQLERERLEMELRRRPPTESDVNAEATAVLRSLYWLALFFRLAADPHDPDFSTGGWVIEGDFSPELKGYLSHVAGVKGYTR